MVKQMNPIRQANVHALVVAAGSGSRFGGNIPKQYLPIDDKCVLQHSIKALACHDDIKNCTLVVAKNDEMAGTLDFALPVRIVVGGMYRWQSVANGVRKISETAGPNDLVLIHDAARPCLLPKDLAAVIAAARLETYGAILAVPVSDTLKLGCKDTCYVQNTVSREQLWQVQTPQVYRLGKLLKVLDFIAKNQRPVRRKLNHDEPPLTEQGFDEQPPHKIPILAITDEAMGFEALGFAIRLVRGSASNLKLTYEGDMAMVKALLAAAI